MMTVFDHILAAALMAFIPLYVGLTFRKDRETIKMGGARVRVQWYWRTIALEWGLVAALAALWIAARRDAQPLGLGLPLGVGFWVTAALVFLAIVFLQLQLIAIHKSPAGREKVRAQLATVSELMPRSPGQMRLWVGVSITAGICEELLYRGFLLWYLGSYMPQWAAVTIAVAVFGLAHGYQGPVNIIKTGLAGLVCMVVYLVTGSLWLGMLLHAAVDINGGQIGRAALGDEHDTHKPIEHAPAKPRPDAAEAPADIAGTASTQS